jgi:hypothetical protein
MVRRRLAVLASTLEWGEKDREFQKAEKAEENAA